MSRVQWYVIAFFSALWLVELAVVGASVYAVLEGRSAWPIIVLAVGFGLAMPYPHKAAKAEP
jgi:hypothetical protein